MVSRLRSTLALVTVLVAIVAVAVPAATAGSISSVQRLERDVTAEINAVRRQHGLRPLRVHGRLRASAWSHSWEMGKHGYFSHYSADGTDPVTRMRRYYPRRGYRSWWVGENLFWWTRGAEARQVVAAWMASPSHRKQLLTPRYREVGVSALHVARAPGAFGGQDVTVVTANFGVRVR